MRLMRTTADPILELAIAVALSGGLALQAQAPAGGSLAIKAHFENAQRALQAGDSATAAAEFQSVLALDPNNVESRANLGVIRFMAEDWPGAAVHFREVLKSKPPSPKAQALLGMCEKRLGRPSEARNLLEQAVPKLQDGSLRITAGLELVEILYAAGELEQAAEFLRVLRRSNPTNADLIYTAHRIYADLSNSTLDTLALTAPESARMYEAMAQRLVNDGDIQGALVQYRKALQIEPLLPGVRNELGQAILQESTSDSALQEAEREFKLALVENPADASAECWLGRIQSLRLNYTAAMAHYSRAFKLRPEYADLRVRMAEALLKLDEKQKALEHLQAAVRIDPLNSIAHYRLATLFRSLGRDAESKKELQVFAELRDATKRIEGVYQQMHRKHIEKDILPSDTPTP
jgi:tetratricopeptide (TPR) repeat protein